MYLKGKKKNMILPRYVYLRLHYPKIVKIQRDLRKTGYLNGSYQWNRHYELLKLFEKYKPVSICELGCGASTGMFALLIKKSCLAVRLVSYEENESYCDDVRKAIDCVHGLVDFRVVPRIIRNSTCFFGMDHNELFDFVYVDAPFNLVDGVLLPCVDVGLMWDNDVFPRVVAVHVRASTVDYLKSHVGSRMYVYSKFGDHGLFVKEG